MEALDQYILEHTSPENELLRELDRETNLRVVQPRMISGHLQGKLLEMIVKMIRPKTILEIGTFTGYSALCMAMALEKGGVLHTIEIDDELESISSKYFQKSGLNDRIISHIGSAIEVAPQLGTTFDLIFIDGDKREYPEYYDMAMKYLVHSGSYILADNILWYGKVAQETPENDLFSKGIKRFNNMIINDNRVENVIIPIRDGLNLIRVR